MSVHLSRAQLLYQQSRYDAAEQEVRQALLEQPQDSYAHALLGLCLMRQDKLPEAQQETEQAIVLDPEAGFPHYCRSIVLSHRRKHVESEQAAREAVRTEPANPDFHAQLGVTLFHQKKWQAALDACQNGLQHDAEHAGCTNLRSMTLTKLGLQSESISTADAALAQDPDNEMAHANKGWALLHEGQPRPALDHFREALRLDPNYEYAQQGIIEALKARNPIYRWMLAYFLWMARLSDRARWGVIIGGYIAARVLSNVGRNYPKLEIWIAPLLIVYLLFVLLTWFAYPFFNLLLRLNKFGRHALSRDQRASSNWFGLCVLLVIAGITTDLTGISGAGFLIAVFGGVMAMPLTTIYVCDAGWPRQMMTYFAIGMAVLGLSAIGCIVASAEIGQTLLMLFALGFIASPWLVNYLASVEPTR